MGYENYYKPNKKYSIMNKKLVVHDVLNTDILQAKIFQYEKLIKEQTERIKNLEQEMVDLKDEIDMLRAINQEC